MSGDGPKLPRGCTWPPHDVAAAMISTKLAALDALANHAGTPANEAAAAARAAAAIRAKQPVAKADWMQVLLSLRRKPVPCSWRGCSNLASPGGLCPWHEHKLERSRIRCAKAAKKASGAR